jgi:effector-binding domain-containing protein
MVDAMTRRLALLHALVLVAACQVGPPAPPPPPTLDVPLARPPFEQVVVQWKERLATRYAFREVRGDYRRSRAELEALLADARRSGLDPVGPGFCLFYDDPADVPTADLRARVCLPVHPEESRVGAWDLDVLPGRTVVYAVVEADHGAVPLAYPSLFRYLADRGWQEDGPVREIYLYQPVGDQGPTSVPWTEVQVPWVPTR